MTIDMISNAHRALRVDPRQHTTVTEVRTIKVRVAAEQLRGLRARPDSSGEVEVDLRQIIGDSDTLEVELSGVDAGGRVALQRDFVSTELDGGVDADVAIARLADDVAVFDIARRVLKVCSSVVGTHAVVIAIRVDLCLEGNLYWC